MASSIDPGIITAAPVAKTDMAQQLTYARDEITALQEDSTVWCGTAGGTANAITLTPSPAATAYVEGMSYAFKALADNSGAVTVAVSGLLAVAINKGNGTVALRTGDITAGAIVHIRYNGSSFTLVSCTYNVAEAQRAYGMDVTRYSNRFANPTMRISQERGTSLVDVTTGTTYAIDQWAAALSTTPGGTLRMQQVAVATPLGSSYRLRATVQVVDAAIAAGDYYTIEQPIEGFFLDDALFGGASARQLLMRFGIRSSIAGTFGVSIVNSAGNRSWIGLLTISAGEVGTDVIKRFTITGDTTGTWLKDNGIGARVRICLAAGTTFQDASTGWKASNLMTTTAQTNFMGTGAATFDVFDAALYVDSYAGGVYPAWQPPDYHTDLARCQRYWESGNAYSFVSVAGVAQINMTVPFREVKRANPIIGGLSASHSAINITTQECLIFTTLTSLSTPWTANARY